VLVLSWLAHRRFTPVLFTTIAVFLGVVWAYGFFIALRGSITMLTAVGAAMLVGLGDDYGVHLYAEHARARDEGLDLRSARAAMIVRAGPRIVVAALTSVGCFVAFGMTGFRGLADLGLLSAIGLFGCLVAFLTLFPLLLRGHVPHEGRTPISIVAGWLAEIPLRFPRGALGFAIAASLASGLVLAVRGPPPFVGDARLLHPKHSPALAALTELDQHVKRPLVPWALLREGDDALALSEQFAALEPKLRELVDAKEIVSFELPARALPPRSQQEAAFAALAGLDPETTVASLRTAAETAGFDPSAFPELESMLRDNLGRAQRREVVTLDELHRLGAGELADTFFRPLGGHLVAAGYLFPTGGLLPGPEQADAVARVQASLSSTPDFALTGFAVVAAELTERVRRDFRGVTWLATAIVVALVLVGSRSWKATALALLPVAVALLWLLALMRVTGSSFNVLNIVLVPMLVGLGVDNGVHLVFDSRETGDAARSLRSLFRPMFVSAITTIAGFGSLATVEHPAVASMGELTAAGITLALIATLLVLPPLLSRAQSRR
jgi:predicted exporter